MLAVIPLDSKIELAPAFLRAWGAFYVMGMEASDLWRIRSMAL